MEIPNADIKISVIVPVYNTEKYIEKCISSILNQNYKGFELILINDGSTDNSYEICNRFAQKDKRVIVLNQQNQGVSAARNVGIKKATGEWCCFVDSDDWVEPNYFTAFLKNQLSRDNLIVQEVKRNINQKYKVSKNYNYKTHTIENLMKNLNENSVFFNGYPFCKLYNLNLIKSKNITFKQHLKIGEDLIFYLEYLKHIKTITFINSAHYVYNYVETSASYKFYTFEQLSSFLNEYQKLLPELIGSNYHKIAQVQKSLGLFLTLLLFSIYNSQAKSPEKQRVEHLKQLSNKENLDCLKIATSKANFIRHLVFYFLKQRNYTLTDFILKRYAPFEFKYSMPIKRKLRFIHSTI